MGTCHIRGPHQDDTICLLYAVCGGLTNRAFLIKTEALDGTTNEKIEREMAKDYMDVPDQRVRTGTTTVDLNLPSWLDATLKTSTWTGLKATLQIKTIREKLLELLKASEQLSPTSLEAIEDMLSLDQLGKGAKPALKKDFLDWVERRFGNNMSTLFLGAFEALVDSALSIIDTKIEWLKALDEELTKKYK